MKNLSINPVLAVRTCHVFPSRRLRFLWNCFTLWTREIKPYQGGL